MRHSTLVLLTFALSPASPSLAQQVGDQIVVVSYVADVKAGTKEVDLVKAGNSFKIEKISAGPWYRITTIKNVQGWVHGNDVALPHLAPGIITQRMRQRPADQTEEKDWIYNSFMFSGRARSWDILSQHRASVIDYTEAIHIMSSELDSPQRTFSRETISLLLSGIYARRAMAWRYLNRIDAAIADIEHAYRFNPESEIARSNEKLIEEYGEKDFPSY